MAQPSIVITHPHLFGLCLGYKLLEAHVLIFNRKTGKYDVKEFPSCQMPAMVAITSAGEILAGYRARNYWYAHKESPVFYGSQLYDTGSQKVYSYKGIEFSLDRLCCLLFNEFSRYLDSFLGKGLKECFVTVADPEIPTTGSEVFSHLRAAGFRPMGAASAMQVALCTKVSNITAKKGESIPFAIGYTVDHRNLLLSCMKFANGVAEEVAAAEIEREVAADILAEFSTETPEKEFLALSEEERKDRILQKYRLYLRWETDPAVMHFKGYEKFAARGAVYHMMKVCGLRDIFPEIETWNFAAEEGETKSLYEDPETDWSGKELYSYLYQTLDRFSQKLNLLPPDEQENPLTIGIRKILRQCGELMKEDRDKWQEADSSALSSYLINKLLDIYDGIENGMRTIPADSQETAAAILGELFQSYEEAMAKCGVCSIEAEGKKFDPNQHYAIMKEASTVIREDYILDEYQKGFRYRGRMIRPSKVKVSID